MPNRPPRRCLVARCPAPVHYRGRCKEHQPAPWQRYNPDPDRPKGRAWIELCAYIFERDGWRCYVCGQPGADQIDHRIPIAEGGARWHESNLGAIHDEPCHKAKSKEEAIRGSRRARKAAKVQRPEA